MRLKGGHSSAATTAAGASIAMSLHGHQHGSHPTIMYSSSSSRIWTHINEFTDVEHQNEELDYTLRNIGRIYAP